MKIFVIILTTFLYSCTNKVVNKPDVFFEILNEELKAKNILSLKITNKSDNNYFICFDTLSLQYNVGLNYRINDCVHPRPVFYFKNDSLRDDYIVNSIIKPTSYDTAYFKCVKENITFRDRYISDFKKLKKIIILKKCSSIILNLPFNNSHIWCNDVYTYIREKGSYVVQFKYKMNKKFINELVEKKLILELEQKNIFPYYEEIISNKVPFIIK